MDRDEEVGLVLIGDVGTALQGQENVGLARVDDFHVGTVAFDKPPKGQRYVEIDGFLLGKGSHGSWVVTAVASIYHQHKLARSLIGVHRQRGAEDEKQEGEEGLRFEDLWDDIEGFQTHNHGAKLRFF